MSCVPPFREVALVLASVEPFDGPRNAIKRGSIKDMPAEGNGAVSARKRCRSRMGVATKLRVGVRLF
jgi:hypothetical protein